jgi:TolA-binding protein
MANQSLKEQIEAAKSALARGAVTAMPAVEPAAPAAAPAAPPITVTENGSANSDDMTTLAARVTALEDQLASNQRDLQTLIRKIREITRVQQDGPSARETETGRTARPKWRKIVSAILAIAAGSAIAGAYVMMPDQMAVVSADIYALFSGVVQQLGQLTGLK